MLNNDNRWLSLKKSVSARWPFLNRPIPSVIPVFLGITSYILRFFGRFAFSTIAWILTVLFIGYKRSLPHVAGEGLISLIVEYVEVILVAFLVTIAETTYSAKNAIVKTGKSFDSHFHAVTDLMDHVLQRLNDTQTNLNDAREALIFSQNDLQSLSSTIAAEHEFLKVIKELKSDPQLERFLAQQLARIATNWKVLFDNRGLVDNRTSRDRVFWLEILSAYVSEEVASIEEGVVVTSFQLYASLLNHLTQAAWRQPMTASASADRPREILCIFMINIVLPEEWYNWPSPNGKTSSSRRWLEAYRSEAEQFVAAVKGSEIPVDFERINLVLGERDSSTGGEPPSDFELPIKPKRDLDEQGSSWIVSNSNNQPFSADVLLDCLSRHHKRLAAPTIAFDNSEGLYYITTDQIKRCSSNGCELCNGKQIPLLDRFINDLHPEGDHALYRVLSHQVVKQALDNSWPFDCMMVGFKASTDDDPSWVFAVSGIDPNPVKSVVKVKVYGQQEVQKLVEWRNLVRQDRRKLADLNNPS